MKRLTRAALAASALLLVAAPVSAVVPPGLLGYEGQPGNQGSGGGGGDGSKVCSPGQQGNPAPGFKPASCNK